MLLKWVGEIKDPIHDFIRFTEIERSIIDSRILQRLRRIKQLAAVELTYPGATHTRFVHSIGVMHIVGLMTGRLAELGYLTNEEVQLARVLGLIHDIGHGPFSHVFEEVLAKKGLTHEDIGRWLLRESELGDLVEEQGFSRAEVASIAFGGITRGRAELVSKVFWGPLSPDTMDYLVRDSYFTGVGYGRVDIGRLIGTLDLVEGELAIEYPGGLTSFEDYVLSRLQMFNAVYFHKTVRAANVMLARAMEWADAHLGLTELKDVDFFLKLDDCYVRTALITLEPYDDLSRLAKELMERLEARRLIKCVYERPVMGRGDLLASVLSRPGVRGKLEAEIAEEAGVSPEEVFVDAPSVPSIPLRPGGESVQIRFFEARGGVKRLMDESEVHSLILGLARYVDLVRVYALPEHREIVRKACEKVLGARPPGG
ncbi:MAG: phosphohydrolase, partial [Thermoplasmata archaeon]